MVSGGLPFVFAAYALTVTVLGGLAVVVIAHALSWRRADHDSRADQEV